MGSQAYWTAMPLLQILVVSTRQGRKGPAVGTWFEQQARAHGAFDVEVVDLAAVALPLFDEPDHPRLRNYRHAHTKAWSETVSRADAFVFVTPEYNHAPAPSLLNAIDYLVHEWAYKPVGFVSYGGVSAGLRAVQPVKAMLCGLRMVPVSEYVAIPMFTSHIDEAGTFTSSAVIDASAAAMLTEIARLEGVLRALRVPSS